MPAASVIVPVSSDSYPAPRKYVLVLSCVDARLLDELERFLDSDNLGNRYYHITLPGASLGLTSHYEHDVNARTCERGRIDIDENVFCPTDDDLAQQFAGWRQTFIDQVQAAVILTKGSISDIYIIEHADCGAYRVYIEKDASQMTAEDEVCLHRHYARALLQDLVQNFCTTYNVKDQDGALIQKKTPFVRTFFMDLRGSVKHLESYPLTDPQLACPGGVPPAPQRQRNRRGAQ